MTRMRYAAFLLCIVPFWLSTTARAAEKPQIIKRGTIDCDLVEATPIVFGGKLCRFEYVRAKYKRNTTGES